MKQSNIICCQQYSEDHICFEFFDIQVPDFEGRDKFVNDCQDGFLIANMDPQPSYRLHEYKNIGMWLTGQYKLRLKCVYDYSK